MKIGDNERERPRNKRLNFRNDFFSDAEFRTILPHFPKAEAAADFTLG